jgi:hypothetical protein
VKLCARDGSVCMNQNQLADLFDTSKQNTGQHTANILAEKELDENSVVKYYLTTAPGGKQNDVAIAVAKTPILVPAIRAGSTGQPNLRW